ncbi:MAG: family 10 glycosylhydrolase [Lewinellaceae bacterium]|nr:family 10 glycosylhydrolase [Saprospiraceae bacterium]MCB9343807.1 family 10 glycosylhydrolase [Lewinellaceae bacterium]
MRFLFSFLFLILLIALPSKAYSQDRRPGDPLKNEMRAVWVATVANIDWPSSPGLSSERQKAEFDSLLDVLKAMNMNAVFVQIRPAGDAFYKSKTVPLSRFLVGKQGTALDDSLYDPLTYMIKATHDRRMEFHAWMNPFRASWDLDTAKLDSIHPLRALSPATKKQWFYQYGTKWYFNPANPSVRLYLVNVVKDVLLRYDVDGIHFDDYFYPYKESGLNLDAALDDYNAFASGNHSYTDIGDWRRANVNNLIENVSKTIKKYKPYVKFGISPFGVYRNKDRDPVNGSNTRAGITCYDDLYADILLWLKNGWVDYVAPQIYWSAGYAPADFEVLLDWWSKHTYGKQLYIGHAAYKINNSPNDPHWAEPEEMGRQIRMARANANVDGSIFFSARPLLKNMLGVQDSLIATLYKQPALMPPMAYLSKATPATATVCRVKGTPSTVQLTWNLCGLLSGDEMPFYYALYRFDGEGIGNLNSPRNLLAVTPFYSEKWYFEDYTAVEKEYYTYVVTSFNRANVEGNPSDPVFVKKTKKGAKKKKKFWGYLF